MASSRKRDAPALDSPTVYVACAVIFAALVSSTVALGDTGPTAQFVTLNSGEYDNDSPVEPPPGDSGNRAGSSGAMSITKERLALDCNRIPSGAIAERTPGSGGFSIRLSGSPKNYVPREGYTGEYQDTTIIYFVIVTHVADVLYHLTHRYSKIRSTQQVLRNYRQSFSFPSQLANKCRILRMAAYNLGRQYVHISNDNVKPIPLG